MNGAEFKYFVINTAASWQEGFGEAIRFYPDGHIALASIQGLVELPDVGHATGFAVDRDGNLYVIDARHCRIYKYLRQQKKFERIFCIGACGGLAGQFRFMTEDPLAFGGWLALGKSTLYVADTFNHRVQAFYRRNFQLRYILGAENQCKHPVAGQCPGEFDHPKDLVTDKKGNLYVLDHGNRRIQKFNKYGGFRRCVGEGVLAAPENIAIDHDDSLYAIDTGKNSVLKFNPRGGWEAIGDFAQIKDGFRPSGLAVDRAKLIYIGEKGEGDLKIHALDQAGKYLGHFGSYAGACYQLLAEAQGRLYANCGPEGQIILLQGNEQFASRGVYYSKRFDSTDTENQWHRLALEADIVERSKIAIFHFASNDAEVSREQMDWQPLLSSPHGGVTPKEGLFENADKRFLWLKIELFGDEFHTPVIRQVKIFFPRLSYLRYLPATYQDDEIGRDFLERFLALFESMTFDMEQVMAQTARYLDPAATDKAFLNWLAAWLAIANDESWSEAKKRKLIATAYQLYKRRGTPGGLKAMIALFIGATNEVAIVEHGRLKRPMILGALSTLGVSTTVGKALTQRLIVEESSTIGEFVLAETEAPPEAPFAAEAFDFTLMVNTSALRTAEERKALKRLIDGEKPAHTRYFLRTSEGEMQLGAHTLVGVDTRVARGLPVLHLGVESIVGVRTFLGTRTVRGTIEIRSKIAVDTILH